MAKYIGETEAALLQKLTRAEEIKLSMEDEHEKKIFLLRMEMEERENSLTALVKSQKMAAQENLVIANKSQMALEQKRKPSRLRKNKAQTVDETLVALIDQNEQKEQQLAVVLCDNAEKDQQLAVMAVFADKKNQELAEMTINAEEKKLQLEEMAMVIEEKDRQISDMAKLIKEKEGALLQSH
ncbi:hypothetical protein AGOR_G00066870 [Albula goreensis]|uniref:Uncharacterized protein n=1 Tax=Albula goreensis TaxID=1534307 RepID=A0A8T3DZ30_9TELE|nr:hypothetical protein AGOR_G00066870 [Albula goreensis]